jgi:mono/diheme cytochrome c family protein
MRRIRFIGLTLFGIGVLTSGLLTSRALESNWYVETGATPDIPYLHTPQDWLDMLAGMVDRWLNPARATAQFAPQLIAQGQQLYMNGTEYIPACAVCHGKGLGPTLPEMRAVAGYRLPGVSASEFVRRFILDPRSTHAAMGFDHVYMFEGYANLLDDQQLQALVAYVVAGP